MYIGHTGDHQWEVDQIALGAPQRPVSLTKTGGELPVEPELLQFGDGRYGLRFDPQPLLPGPASVSAQFALPGGEHTAAAQFAGARAEGDALLVAPAAQDSGPDVIPRARPGHRLCLVDLRRGREPPASRPDAPVAAARAEGVHAR
jgi:hypothetical protein